MSPEELQDFIATQMSGPPVIGPPVTSAPPTADSEPEGVPPVDWRILSGEEKRKAWTELREWVEWFTVRYDVPISIVPTCWWKHGHLVEELSALHVAHQVSFDPNDTGYGPLGFHERWATAHQRLQRAGGGCNSQHHDTKPRSWIAATDEAEWDAWID